MPNLSVSRVRNAMETTLSAVRLDKRQDNRGDGRRWKRFPWHRLSGRSARRAPSAAKSALDASVNKNNNERYVRCRFPLPAASDHAAAPLRQPGWQRRGAGRGAGRPAPGPVRRLAGRASARRTAGGTPYRRKVPTFNSSFDKELGAATLRMGKVEQDKTSFKTRYEPGHPAADANGYVKYPNVDPLVETVDMREAQRSYE
eukprot:gene41179-55692_t